MTIFHLYNITYRFTSFNKKWYIFLIQKYTDTHYSRKPKIYKRYPTTAKGAMNMVKVDDMNMFSFSPIICRRSDTGNILRTISDSQCNWYI